LETGRLDYQELPLDEDESSLLALYVRRDTVSRRRPEQINIDSLLADSLARANISRVRHETKSYFLDSVYTDMLLRDGRFRDAYGVAKPYLAYHNTVRFARMVRALFLYQDGKHARAARDIVLSRTRAPQWLFLLANSLRLLGREADYLYEDVIKMSSDSALIHRAQRELVRIHYDRGAYADVVKFGFEIARNDTQLVELYAYSLAREGNYSEAVSIFEQYFQNVDYDLKNYYGEFLIEKKKYSSAQAHYDSIVMEKQRNVPVSLYYNWALIPFLQGNIDTAMARFQYLRRASPRSAEVFQVFFKIATLYYAQQEFDSAAHYYGLASEDDSLRVDALQNQLVCFKKSSRWADVIDVGNRLLEYAVEEEKHSIMFELGYAFLRSGIIRQAVEFLKTAAILKPSQEYYYWLAETYLGKGNFVRALYYYQKTIDAFPEDDMWTPTAWYKTGIVLEFLGEYNDARDVYEQITRKRGRSDTWSIEAQKRIEALDKGKR
jgi:tetratricopeptide (TPR) repeat protein